MKTLTLLLCSCLIATALQAQVIHVPDDYISIQQGIDAASPGDTVLVSDGIYYEQINFKGKSPLMVASQFLTDGNEGHIANTIIDGSQLINMDSASVVYFVNGEDTNSILCGFTILNGRGTFTPDNYDDRQGGGIWISEAGAKIIHNRITHNTIDDTQLGNGNSTSGCGIGTKVEENDEYWVVIESNIIDSNTCISKYEYAWGGGIATSYNSRICNNIISHNLCSGILDAAAEAAGIACWQEPQGITPIIITIDHNTITHNMTQSQSNFANSAGGMAGNVRVVFSNNQVANNMVITGTSSGGVAGLNLWRPDPGCVIKNNVFRENVSNLWTGGLGLENDEILDNMVLVENNYFIDNEALNGGAFVTFSAPVILQNNVFSGNHADSSGGAICMMDNFNHPVEHLVTLVNNSFSANIAARGGAIQSVNASLLIFNCIFWQDSASSGEEIFTHSGYAEIAWSNIDPDKITGSYVAGNGIMNEDPLFEDLIYLKPAYNSPCIDQGVLDYTCSHDETVAAPEYDINGLSRPREQGNDMGAYEHPAIIHVPADFIRIQEAIDAANPGETVLVSDGSYLEQINFKGKKPLTVASEFLTDGDTNHIFNTIIDGRNASNPDSASVVYFISGEDTTSILCGFTVQGGRGTYWDTWESMGGAGIYITNSTATIRYNIIHNNFLNDTLSSSSMGCLGGGIHSSYGAPGWVVIENNKISGNSIISNHDWTEGGGIYVYGTHARVTNNEITGNLSKNTGYGFSAAGGMICEGAEMPVEAIIRDNLIESNEARAIEYGYGAGMGAWLLADSSIIANNKFIKNKNDWNGGGLDIFSTSLSTFKIEGNYFIENEALNGGAIDVDSDSTSQVILINNILST
jgi:hypothetical protein